MYNLRVRGENSRVFPADLTVTVLLRIKSPVRTVVVCKYNQRRSMCVCVYMEGGAIVGGKDGTVTQAPISVWTNVLRIRSDIVVN